MGDVPNIDVLAIDTYPNNCPIGEELNVRIDFHNDLDIIYGKWKLQYMVDSSNKRVIVELGESETCEYVAGDHTFSHHIPEINVSGIKPSTLANVGLLMAILYDGEEEIIQINMVTQVSRDAHGDGVLTRTIFNPLE